MRARRPVQPTIVIQCVGGCTFAEDPGRTASVARIIWHANVDPGVLSVIAAPASKNNPDAIDPASLAPWLSLAVDHASVQHAVLSDGRCRIRFDVEQGELRDGSPVILHYQLLGTVSGQPKLLPLRRLIELCLSRRFASYVDRDRRMERNIMLLRASDALRAEVSQREMARGLLNEDWSTADPRSDSIRSRVRRLVRSARALADGGFWHLLRE